MRFSCQCFAHKTHGKHRISRENVISHLHIYLGGLMEENTIFPLISIEIFYTDVLSSNKNIDLTSKLN